MSYKGRFKPKNISKYKGDPTKVIYRSLWELRFMRWCDQRDSVLKWASEEVIIPYRSPIDGRRHRYFPDFWVKILNADGQFPKVLSKLNQNFKHNPLRTLPRKMVEKGEDILQRSSGGESTMPSGELLKLTVLIGIGNL